MLQDTADCLPACTETGSPPGLAITVLKGWIICPSLSVPYQQLAEGQRPRMLSYIGDFLMKIENDPQEFSFPTIRQEEFQRSVSDIDLLKNSLADADII